MIAHLISIGNELLMGDTVNTNASWLGQFLHERGVQVTQVYTITDAPEHIKSTIQQALDEADLVISTGGLGPTLDDVTKKSVAELFGVGMRHEPSVEEHIKDIFRRRNLPYSPPIKLRHYSRRMQSCCLILQEPHLECYLSSRTHCSLYCQGSRMK